MAENKKDSFTFSDKIKNSKPAFNPFSKRVSSKIGSNGKPKKTLFERTRRDAPFFVAAAAALLMLPFLYKYSGSVNEDPIVPPGSEDSIFDPERFGFEPNVEDPNGQIAQLSGRDPLSMIKGWGTPEPAEPSYSYDRDGLDDAPYTAPVSRSNSYRETAPAQTRASFQRNTTPTKIKEMGSASMNFRGGGGGMGRFGGANLKAAAKQPSADKTPKQGPKPVSLQPLRAAGNPSRSYFGQGSAAQARASRDAMSKANALQALSDADFKPIENAASRGGIGGADFFGGGGAGKWSPSAEYKGITPWWWDLMKKRDQMQWEWRFKLWREGVILPLVKKLGEILAEFGGGLTCCLLTGEDDCSMGSMWGTDAGGGSSEGCKIAGADPVSYDQYCKDFPDKKDPNGLCANDAKTFKEVCKGKQKAGEHKWEWVAAKGAGGELNFVEKRFFCMGATVKGKGAPTIKDRHDCAALDKTHNVDFQTGGKANNWYHYHIVVAKNYFPGDATGKKYLCGTNIRNYNKKSGSGIGAVGANTDEKSVELQEAYKKTQDGKTTDYRNEGLNPEEENDACVIYVAEGKFLDWDNFKSQTKDLLAELNGKEGFDAEKAFNGLHLLKVEGFAMKNKMSRGVGKERNADDENNASVNGKKVRVRGMPVELLPIKYVDFQRDHVWTRQSSKESKEETFRKKERNKNTRKEKQRVVSDECYFTSFRITADAIESVASSSTITAQLTFDPKVHGANAKNIQVSVQLDGGDPLKGEMGDDAKDGVVTVSATIPDAVASKLQVHDGVTALWTARYGEKISQDTATYYGGYGPAPQQPTSKTDCKEGETQTITKEGDPCEYVQKCGADGKWGTITKKDPNCGKSEDPKKNKDVVTFFGKIGSVLSTQNPLALRSSKNQESTSSCQVMQDIEGGVLLTVDSDVENVLERAKKAYNDQHKDSSELLYKKETISVANLLDAMAIVKTDIPLNAVCMLGKTIGAKSKDSKVNTMNNMFGTFAAYIGEDSSFFPTLYVKNEKQEIVLDRRFYGCANKKEQNGNKAYHYGHYNWNHEKLGDQTKQKDREPFESVLANGPWKDFPLQKIAKAVNFKRNTEWDTSKGEITPTKSMDAQNRAKYHEAYKHVFQGNGGCNLSSSETMTFEEVKKYINLLCQEGNVGIKPTNGNQLACSDQFEADTNAYN